MKKSLSTLLALAVCAGFLAMQTSATAAEAATHSKAPGAEFAQSISTITGVAISPLLGTGAYGAVKYFRTPQEKRANLPWFAQPWFWVPALLLVAACFVKDTAGTALPTAVKKPLDVADAVEHKISGLVAAGAFVPFIAMMSHEFGSGPGAGTLSSMGFAAIDLSWLYNIIMVPVAIVAFFFVFLASNAINILILLSPFTTVDAGLKAFRTAILATVVGTAFVNSWMGAAWAIVIIGFSYLIAGWSFRLSHFGLAFVWDFVTFRRKRFSPNPKANKVFLGRKINKVPTRTYGRLSRNEAGKLVLNYRPWLVLPPRTLELPEGNYAPGRGLFYSEILRIEGEETRTMILLPPRYRGHETELEKIYGFSVTRDVGIRAMWAWLRRTLGFKNKAQPAVT
jgi:MFS family permease